ADDQVELGPDHQQRRAGREWLGEEQPERQDELGYEVADRLEPMDPPREVVEEPAEGVRHRLGLVVELHAGEVPPAWIAAKLDQARPELDPERQPPESEDHRQRWADLAVAEEDREEAGLEQQRLPTEAVERAADVDDRLVQDPEHEPGKHRDR